MGDGLILNRSEKTRFSFSFSKSPKKNFIFNMKMKKCIQVANKKQPITMSPVTPKIKYI